MSRITIDERFCKGCHLCVDQCPQNVYQISSKRNQKGYLVPTPTGAQRCKACLVCEMICPDMVITVEKLKDER